MKGIKYLIGAVIVVVIFVVLLKTDSSNHNKAGKQDTESAKKFQLEPQVKELCSKYNAVTDWKQRIGKKEFGEHTYTIEVEDALIRTDGRPILFNYGVYDIVRESDNYLVYFSVFSTIKAMNHAIASGLDFFLSCDVHFVLDCTADQVKQIINHPTGCYAVIAQISEVEKVRFKLEGYSGKYEDVGVDLGTSDVFMAKGKCLDLLLVADEPKDEKKQ